MSSHREYEGVRVLVTGAAAGVGEATARLFGASGADVAVCDIDAKGARRVANSITREAGVKSVPITVDVTDDDAVNGMVSDVVDALGGLEVAHINAATFVSYGDALTTTPEQWDTTQKLNLRGAFLTSRAVLSHLVKGPGGVLCFTGSDTALRTSYDYAAYVASKHGVLGLARSIAVDFGGRGVRSNVVTPGVTDTPGLRALYSTDGRNPRSEMEAVAKLSPLGRVATPADIAEAVVFLCSRRADYITGANLVVDGAMTVTYGAQC